MPSNAQSSSQGAVYKALANANICDGRITDNPQPDTSFPHVELGETDVTNMKLTGLADGTDETMLINIWSRSEAGAIEVKDIMGQVVDALDGKRLSWPGRDVVSYVLDANVRREADGTTRRGLVRVQIVNLGPLES